MSDNQIDIPQYRLSFSFAAGSLDSLLLTMADHREDSFLFLMVFLIIAVLEVE